MTGKVLSKKWHAGVLRQSLSVCLLAGGILAVLLAGVWTLEARAQDEGPVCPPGFEYERMSGVGCVQADCYDNGGRLSYTSACICNDGFKACTEPVDFSNFDPEFCGVHCPGSRLVACVPPEELCPGEEPPPMEWEEPPAGGILAQVEDFIVSGDQQPPTPGRAAAAAITGSVMLGFWSLVQGLGQQSSQVVKSGISGLRQPLKSSAEVPGTPDLRGQAGGLVKDAAAVIDKWPRGGKADEAATILREADSGTGPAVFYGEDARLILIAMGKLPSNTDQSEKLLIGQGDFSIFVGTHPSGDPQLVRLASGREALVEEVLSVGYEDALPSETGSVEIDFSPRLVLTAKLALADPLETSTSPAPVDPDEMDTLMRRDLEEDQEDNGEGQA